MSSLEDAFVVPEDLNLLEYNSSYMSTQIKADGELRRWEVERNGQFFCFKGIEKKSEFGLLLSRS